MIKCVHDYSKNRNLFYTIIEGVEPKTFWRYKDAEKYLARLQENNNQ